MRYYMKRIVMILALFTAFSAAGAPWATPKDEERVLQGMREFFQGAEIRHPGSAGNLAIEARVAERFAETGFEHGEIAFTAPSFIPGRTTLTLKSGHSVALFPMHPSLFRPGNFTEKEFSAPMVYLGRGTDADLDRLRGIDLTGAIALMEFDSGSAWLRYLRFGVRGFVFIGANDYRRSDALSKVYTSEVAVPRFFATKSHGAMLKHAIAEGGAAVDVAIRAEPSRWENRQLRDLWVLIPGSDPDLGGEVCVITAPMDANCIVPGMAAGAQAGANLYLLMELLAGFRANAPARSVLLTAVNAHTQNFRGERMLAWYLLANGVEGVRDRLSEDLREQRLLVDYYSKLKLDSFRQEDEDTIIKWRSLVDDTTGKNITVKNAVIALAKRDVNSLKERKLLLTQQFSRGEIGEAEAEAAKSTMDEALDRHVNVLTLFNKVGIKTILSELSPDESDILRGYVSEIISFNSAAAALNEEDLLVDKQNSAVRDALKGRRAPFVICLDLDWDSPLMGFCSMNLSGAQRWAFRWGSSAVKLAEGLDAIVKEGRKNLLLDTMTMKGGLSEKYYFALGANPIVQKSAVTYFHNANRTPAFSLMNTFTSGGKAFLPTDTIDRLDAPNLAKGMAFVPALLRALLDDSAITSSTELPLAEITGGSYPLWSTSLKTFKFDELAASVYPDIPVSGSVAILRPDNAGASKTPFWQDGIVRGGVVNADILLTDGRAAGVIYGLREGGVSSAFRFDKDFTIVDHAIDAGEIHKKLDSNNLRHEKLMLAMFNCFEFPIYSMADSSMIGTAPISITDMLPLLGMGDSCPRKFGFTGFRSTLSTKRVNPTAGAPGAFYFVPNERIKLLTPHKRLALNNTPEEYEGRGFASSSELGFDIFGTMAGDMSILNHARLNKLKDVANELVRDFLKSGDKSLERMRAAAGEHRHMEYLRAMYEALGNQVKSYEQAKQTSDDMLKAVVVYMALLLPFCMFVQKLIFKFVKIEHELAMFAFLFVTTFLVFRVIHPAFRVAQTAEAIFIAFVMGALGLFVISILRGRFEGEMQVLFRSYMGGTGDVGYSTVTQKALLIGVNNMKRRRIRTMLTTATIVLIAFTMLSFTSISKKVNPTIVPKAREAPYTGIMYSWPGKSTMDEATLNVFRDLFTGSGDLVVRRWLVADGVAPFLARSSSGAEAQFEALLGLQVSEDGFIGPVPLVGGHYFSSDFADEALISERAAELLGVDRDNPGLSRLTVQGRTLKVVGIFDDERFRHLRDLNGRPITPIKRIARDTAFGQDVDDHGRDDVELDEGMLSYVDVVSLLIVPVDLAMSMGAEPYSVSLKMLPDSPIWPTAEQLLTVTKAKFYMSSVFPFAIGSAEKNVNGGVFYIGSNYSTSVGGLAVLLIPLLIASTIILNTMLGSVYERKKEIAVYNAVGLNPHHIGMFFLAESFVYGVIGSVGGYLIGQVLSITINQLGIVKDINLNYSSLSVAYVILFTIAIVLLSTIYPATVATRAAVPSGKRKWSLPEHDGHTMKVVFPFIYHPRVARGVLGYLDEYFSRFTEASIGDLIASMEQMIKDRDDHNRERFTMEYHIALAPYDLGVTQNMIFNLYYDDQVQAYRLVLKITRVSGQDSNWVTTNRPFLEQLRKYLLRWRNLDISQQGLYVQEAKALFSETDGTKEQGGA